MDGWTPEAFTTNGDSSMKIHVNHHHIDWALQQKSTLCAVSLALRDANDDWVLPRVTQDTIRYTDRRTQERVIIPTPPEVAEFIDAFDRQREAVGPITFNLDLRKAERRPMTHIQPSEAIAQAERRRKREALNPRTTQKKTPQFTNTSKRELRNVEVTGLVD
jgi:hypothetical protein